MLESLTSSMFFPGLEGCECGPSLSTSCPCFLYIHSPPSGKLELLLAYPSTLCFSFLVAFLHISSAWDGPPFLVWFHHSCLWAWARGRGLSPKDIGDFIKSPKESYRKNKVPFYEHPILISISPCHWKVLFPCWALSYHGHSACQLPQTHMLRFSSLIT